MAHKGLWQPHLFAGVLPDPRARNRLEDERAPLLSRKLLALWCFAFVSSVGMVCARANDPNSAAAATRFFGPQSCNSTSCHGGAATNTRQYTVWQTCDFHHLRPYATLKTARAERFAEVLRIGDPAQTNSCTACHAPFQTVPPLCFDNETNKEALVKQGVSCESCHGAAQNWLRGHTRRDWTHADRVQAGMRDLKNLYVRANVCIACHQNLTSDIRAAGHPELIFELDGQAVSQPKHWRPEVDKSGPQIWLVGQAVALREMSWQLEQEKAGDRDLSERWEGLKWLAQLAGQADPRWPALALTDPSEVRSWSDQFAREVAECIWSDTLTRKCLGLLSNTANSFTNTALTNPIQARRAERLVLGLDRLVLGLGQNATNSAVNKALNNLFDCAQSLPDFDRNQFARRLKDFRVSLSEIVDFK